MCWQIHWPEWSLSTSGRILVFSRLIFPQGEVMSQWAILTWWEDWFLPWSNVRAEPFYHGERIGSFHVRYECLRFWCDCRIGSYMIRYKGYCHYLNGGTWLVTRNTQYRIEGHSDMTVRCVLTWLDMSAWPFWCDWGMCSHLIKYKGCFHSVMVRGLFPSMSDVSAGHSDLGSDIRATTIL